MWVPLPNGRRSRDVRCTFLTKELQLTIGGGEADGDGEADGAAAPAPGASLGGKLKGPVVIDDCYWVIDEDAEFGRVVQVVLAKKGEFTRWAGVLVGEVETG